MARVKVVPGSLTEAYKKREGDFAPNLVGLQFTEGVASLGTSLFTFGNFEITSNFDPENTRLIFAVSEKDMAEDPRFKSWTKKDGTPAYFQPMPADMSDMRTFDQHGYIMTVPTFPFTILGHPMRSATEVRAQFAGADPKKQKAIVQDLFGGYNDQVLHILQTKLGK